MMFPGVGPELVLSLIHEASAKAENTTGSAVVVLTPMVCNCGLGPPEVAWNARLPAESTRSMVPAGWIVIWNVAPAVFESKSVTVIVRFAAPVAVGIPLRIPSEVNFSPAGILPDADQR